MAAEHLGRWAPLPPEATPDLFAGCGASWWVAGGWAIDLLVGQQTRPHGDLDVLVLRHEQHVVRAHLDTWDVHAADPPGSLRPWPVPELLPAAVHDVWCRPDLAAPWAFQLMIDDVNDGEWMFRRDNRIRRPIDSLSSRASRPTLPVLAPEIQLLYKSHALRPKDVTDFHTVLPFLSADERSWLEQALRLTSPNHEWIHQL